MAAQALERRLGGCGPLLALQHADFPTPGMNLVSPALAGGFCTTGRQKPLGTFQVNVKFTPRTDPKYVPSGCGGRCSLTAWSWEMLTVSWLSALGASCYGILTLWAKEGGPDLLSVE